MPIYNPSLEQTATLIVAASDSLYPERADFTCDGTADEAEINAAFALGAANTRVVLLDGTYTLADPIALTNNNQTLEGQGRATFLDGDGLATTEHAIVIDGKTHCSVKNLAIQTEDGGGKTCYCIHITNGANNCTIDKVIIVDSDNDGIFVDGTETVELDIIGCHIEDTDGHGIYVNMSAGKLSRSHFIDNTIESSGGYGMYINDMEDVTISGNHINSATNCGIVIFGGSSRTNIINNTIASCTQSGIYAITITECNIEGNICLSNGVHGMLLETTDKCSIVGNTCRNNTQHGIYLFRCDYNTVTGNSCNDNTQDGINATGDGTANCDYNVIADNICYNNTSDGVAIVGGTDANGNHITGNYVAVNNIYGITVAGVATKIADNYIYHNGGGAAGTYHGIYLAGTSDRCSISGNTIEDDGSDTEDGVCLADGATECQIDGNYIYNLMGDGIKLAGSNTSTLIKDNYCLTLDENGIVITDSVDCTVSGNHCENNTHHGIYLDNVDEANVSNNYCRGNDRLNAATYDGIYVDVDSSYVNIVGNHCTENDRYGIYVLSTTCELTANHALTNTTGQISAAAGCVLAHNETGATAEVHEPREATIVVAASDSLTASADYVCDGTADDVQINAALNALPTDGGRVILLEGTFTIVDPIVIPDDSITLEGQGRTTFIDGDGLATTEHGITIDGKTHVTLKNFAIQTMDGGAKTCHCIFAEDGCDNLTIDGITIVASDSDGIHIEGTTIKDVRIHGCYIDNVDTQSIYVNMDGFNYIHRLRITDNAINNSGQYGMYLNDTMSSLVSGNCVENSTTAGFVIIYPQKITIEDNTMNNNSTYGFYIINCRFANIVGNTATNNTLDGIYLLGSNNNNIVANSCISNGNHGIYILRSSYCGISSNNAVDNTADGINVTGDGTANSDYNTVNGNVCYDNGDDGIAIEGTTDANKNIVTSNQLTGNTGTALVDNGTATQIGHNVTA